MLFGWSDNINNINTDYFLPNKQFSSGQIPNKGTPLSPLSVASMKILITDLLTCECSSDDDGTPNDATSVPVSAEIYRQIIRHNQGPLKYQDSTLGVVCLSQLSQSAFLKVAPLGGDLFT